MMFVSRGNWSKVFHVAMAAMIIAGFVFVCLESLTAAITYTYGVRLKVIVVKAGKDAEPGMDLNLSKRLQKALKKKFRRKFKSFTRLSEKTAAQRFNKPRTWSLPNGTSMIMTVISHKKDQINTKIEYNHRVMLPTMWNKKHWMRRLSNDAEPYILCIWPVLRQTQRGK